MHPKTSHLQIPKYFVLAMLFEPVNGYRLIMFPTILHWLAAKTNEWLSPLFSTVDNKTECAPWQY